MSHKKNLKKRGFTLVELMVCLSLLVALGGFFVFQSKKMMDAYKFKASASSFVQELILTKHLAMLYHIDIDLEIMQVKDALILKRCSMEKPSFEAHQFKKEIKLSKIASLTYKGVPISDYKLSFDENGVVISNKKDAGEFILYPISSKKEDVVTIQLDKI